MIVSNESQVLGIVHDGKFRPVTSDPGPSGYTGLTTIQIQTSLPPEAHELDLAEYEGKAIMVYGNGGGEWIYSAKVIDEAGPILTAVVGQVFGEIGLAGLESSQASTPDLVVPDWEELKIGRTTGEQMLIQARESLHQEWAGIQVLGRELTEQEKQRSDALGRAVKLIDEALAVLGADD
jgi:hypothetical protein